jgi:hypothetical protein
MFVQYRSQRIQQIPNCFLIYTPKITLAQITKVLKIEIFEFFRPGEKPEKGISATVIKYLNNVDNTIMKSSK